MTSPGRSEPDIDQAVEAILFTGISPLSAVDFRRAFPDVPAAAVESSISRLRDRYHREGRPYTIKRTDDGHVMELAPSHRQDLARVAHTQREVTLSRSVIEVLSVVAYRQPIGKTEIDEVLGLDSASTLRQLVRRGLVTVHREDASETAHYITTRRFLDLFGLDSLADLPSSEDLDRG